MASVHTLNVNGRQVKLEADDPQMPLLYALRNQLGLTGPHFGCGLAQCGACTVHVAGQAVRACSFPLAAAAGKAILTLEGLGAPGRPHPLQQAFIDEQAAQCGYCATGIIMSAKALLDANPHPTDAQIRAALKGNLCRCGTHQRILKAIKRVAEAVK